MPWSEHAHAAHATLRLLSQGHGFHLRLLRDLCKLRIALELLLVDCVQKLLLLDTRLLVELILSAALLDQCRHHHLHLTFRRHLIHVHHARILHHLFHLLHLDVLLFLVRLYRLVLAQHLAARR